MSCENNANKIGHGASASGISKLASKGAYAGAAIAGAWLGNTVTAQAQKYGLITRGGLTRTAGALTGSLAATESYRLQRANIHAGIKNATQKVSDALDAATGKEADIHRRVKKATQTAGDALAAVATKQAEIAQSGAPLASKALTGINTVERSRFPRAATAVGLGYAARQMNIGKMMKLAKLVGHGSASVANPLAGMARQSLSASVVQEKRVLLFFKKKTAVEVWNSKAGRLLNRADSIVPQKDVLASKSATLKIDGVTWHRGTTTFRAPDGKTRTLTHLQSLNFPAQHYYFNTPLSDKESAGIVTRQPGYTPQRMRSYLGQVSAMDSLSPGWATAKHSLIKTAALSGAPTAPARSTPRISRQELQDAARSVRGVARDTKHVLKGGQ